MTVDQWAAVVGFVLPAVIAVVNRAEWKAWLKALVALGTSVLAGTVTALLSGDFTGSTWLQAIGIAFAASAASYKLWWKSSGISDKIEQAVNVVAAGKLPSNKTPIEGEEDGGKPESS